MDQQGTEQRSNNDRTVLIVDDDPMILALLNHQLIRAGFRTVSASNGGDALQALRAQRLSLVLSDWMMPGMNGLDLCRAIRADDTLPYVYILILTGRQEEEDVTLALDAGADDYLTKPFSQSELLARLRAGERVIRLQADLMRANTDLETQVDESRRVAERLRFQSAALEKTTQALAESETRHRTITESVKEAIITCDRDGKVLYWNPAAESLFGYKADEVLGRNMLYQLVPQRYHEDKRKGMAIFAKTGEGAAFGKTLEVSALHKDGTEFPVALSLAACENFGQATAVAVVRDIRERKRAEADRIARIAMEKDRNHLRSAVRAHERVLSVVGHELRTPLAGVRAMAEFLLLEDARQSAEFDVFVCSIKDEITRLADLVNDLVEVGRLNSGTAKWNWGQVALSEVCHLALDAVRPLVDQSRIKLTAEVTPPDLSLRGDAGAIRRLLVNLLSNAQKNTTDGSISVCARPLSRDERPRVEIQVRDSGSGMTPEVAGRLGEAFALNSGVVGEDHVKGSGLGLAISKGIVAAHGGTISVASVPGHGTTMTVLLRTDLPEPCAIGTAAAISCEIQS